MTREMPAKVTEERDDRNRGIREGIDAENQRSLRSGGYSPRRRCVASGKADDQILDYAGSRAARWPPFCTGAVRAPEQA